MDKNRFYLTKRYITALTIIAVLSILAFINMSYLINSQANDGKAISASGAQVMLSQQIALYAIYYQTEQLEKSIRDMRANHQFLIEQQDMPDELKTLYFEQPVMLNTSVSEFIQNAERFRLTTDGKSLTYVLRNSQRLLADLSKASELYLKAAEAKTAQLRRFEVLICLATLVTLLLEALFIFRPANATIQRKTKELTDEKNYSNAVLELGSNAIISIDENEHIKTYNNKAEEIFGYKKEQMRRTDDLLSIVPPLYAAAHSRGLSRYLRTIFPKIRGRSYDIKLLNSKKELFPCRISFGGKTEATDIIVINIEDITQERLKNTLLHKQAKFAALGEMIAIIAHQWRQPLAELSLNNMYIKKKIKQPELLEELGKNGDIIRFMSETIKNFEDFYKSSENSLFDPKNAIYQAINIVEKILKLKEIELILQLNCSALVFGQQNSLAQVILSIVQNSIDKHSQTPRADKQIKIDLQEQNAWINLVIEDNAGGIAVKPIEAIFEPFYTGKKSSSTGLGLYMSKLVVEEKFSGSISARNSKKGAVLSIELPISQT